MKTTNDVRTYRVDETTIQDGQEIVKPHLVKATHPDTATSFVAKKILRTRVATQGDLEELIGKVEMEIVPRTVRGPRKTRPVQESIPLTPRILPADDPVPGFSVAETDGTGKPTHLVVEAQS